MKILLVSFFYPPDIGPGSFRAKTFTDALQKYGPKTLKIDVITTFPTRKKSSEPVPECEINDNLEITRIKIPTFKKHLLYQLYIFFYFSIKTLIKVQGSQYDLVIATSGRSGTAILGALIARFKSAKFYLDLREIFPENIKDLFKGWKGVLLNKVFALLERFSINTATKVNLISPGFLDYYQKHYPLRRFSCHMHAVDPIFVQPLRPKSENATRLKVCYAGNIGYGQQLHLILPELAKKTAEQIDFYVIGGGNNLELLKYALKEKNISNVTLLPGMPRKQLIFQYQNSDILFLHVYPYDFSLRVLPSKIFEYAATGKPIWAGVTGYAKKFITQEIPRAAVFTPCDVSEALFALSQLELNTFERTEFLHKFNQENLMMTLAHEILSL